VIAPGANIVDRLFNGLAGKNFRNIVGVEAGVMQIGVSPRRGYRGDRKTADVAAKTLACRDSVQEIEAQVAVRDWPVGRTRSVSIDQILHRGLIANGTDVVDVDNRTVSQPLQAKTIDMRGHDVIGRPARRVLDEDLQGRSEPVPRELDTGGLDRQVGGIRVACKSDSDLRPDGNDFRRPGMSSLRLEFRFPIRVSARNSASSPRRTAITIVMTNPRATKSLEQSPSGRASLYHI